MTRKPTRRCRIQWNMGVGSWNRTYQASVPGSQHAHMRQRRFYRSHGNRTARWRGIKYVTKKTYADIRAHSIYMAYITIYKMQSEFSASGKFTPPPPVRTMSTVGRVRHRASGEPPSGLSRYRRSGSSANSMSGATSDNRRDTVRRQMLGES